MNNIPRSIRNNNPFNIKKSSSRWLGKVKGNDKVFESFDTMEHGLRAGIKLLVNYVKKGYNTPRKIISRFAPSSENNVVAYLRFVCTHCSLPPDYVFTGNDVEPFVRFLSVVIMYESTLVIRNNRILEIINKFNLNLPYEKD